MDVDLKTFTQNVDIKDKTNKVIISIELKEMLRQNNKIILRLEYDSKILNEFIIRRKYVK